MKPEDLRKMLDAATPGPWTWRGEPCSEYGNFIDRVVIDTMAENYGPVIEDHEAPAMRINDLNLIRDLRNLAPLLLDLWEAVELQARDYKAHGGRDRLQPGITGNVADALLALREAKP